MLRKRVVQGMVAVQRMNRVLGNCAVLEKGEVCSSEEWCSAGEGCIIGGGCIVWEDRCVQYKEKGTVCSVGKRANKIYTLN